MEPVSLLRAIRRRETPVLPDGLWRSNPGIVGRLTIPGLLRRCAPRNDGSMPNAAGSEDGTGTTRKSCRKLLKSLKTDSQNSAHGVSFRPHASRAKRSFVSRRRVQLEAALAPPGASFEAASRRLRMRGLEVIKLRKSALKPLESLSRVTLCASPPRRA
jgi:hypothetical protein